MSPPAPAAQFAAIIDLLCRTVAARIGGGRLAGPLIILICRRLRRMATRFAALAARAGARPRPATAVARRPASPRPASARPAPALPRGVAWLVRLVPESSAAASQLQHLLTGPEMAALTAAAPQAGRILRPLCRMLGVRPPAHLVLPPPARRAPKARPASAGGAPASASPPDPPPRRKVPMPAPPILLRACGPPGDAT